MNPKRLVIVGGVAGGASAAARARRLSEDAQIVVFERGPHVSFANCGLPYHIGGEIPEEGDLLLQTPQALRARFNLDVRVNHEVVRIDPKQRTVWVRNLNTLEECEEPYDALILATGAAPLRPRIPGIELPGHFTVRNIPNIQAIQYWLKGKTKARAVVVGGGYIGLEMAEQLKRRGLQVSLVEALPQVMAPLDPEMAAWLHKELQTQGVDIYLGDPVSAFEPPAATESHSASTVVLKSGKRLSADLVILGLGVRPEVHLAKEAGLTLGELGGIRVDSGMKTSDPHIWAVGDAVETRDWVTGQWGLVPLAGPANRQGRIAADNVFGRPSRYRGTLGTAILRLFELSAGCAGANEKTLKRLSLPYQAIHLHPGCHAGYYPGATPVALKILFNPDDGKILGVQAVGRKGIDKRIDVIATAIQGGMTVHDLAEMELAYAPPFGSAKDPVNLAGMAASNVLNGDVQSAQWHQVSSLDPATTTLLDVRTEEERKKGFIPGSIHIPLHELRRRVGELPAEKDIVVHCQSGQRSYFAARMLVQRGFKVRNLTGSYRTWLTATT
jgi:NADPH-dependent 2,4-dienoyl-CoA reductase/sulfur reductase-like enzyme/rhodanese-related sulfurtransferase